MFVVEVLRIETIKRYKRALIAMIVIDTSINRREVRCLIDFEVERNFLSQTFVKKARLLKSDLSLNIILIDEQKVSKK